MFETPKDIPQIDLERHMNDYASRVQMSSLGQKRVATMQKLLLKIQSMSDKDFDMAFSTIETVVDNLTQKKQSPMESDKDKSTKNNLSNMITSRP